MHVVTHPEAAEELTHAALWYEDKLPGLGEAFKAIMHLHRRPFFWKDRS